MTDHVLKSWQVMFGPTLDGTKPFELRKNDRDFAVGDRLRLREWDPTTKTYTGRECWRRVSYMVWGGSTNPPPTPFDGLADGYCILGLGT